MEGKIEYKFGKNVFLKNNKNTLYTTDKHKYKPDTTYGQSSRHGLMFVSSIEVSPSGIKRVCNTSPFDFIMSIRSVVLFKFKKYMI